MKMKIVIPRDCLGIAKVSKTLDPLRQVFFKSRAAFSKRMISRTWEFLSLHPSVLHSQPHSLKEASRA